MILRWFAALAAAAVCCQANAAPLEVYGQLPAMSDVTVSPDGAKVAYITHAGDQEGVIVAALDPAAKLFGGNFGPVKLRGLVWADPSHLLVIKSVTKEASFVMGSRAEWSILLGVDLPSGKVTRLFEGVPNSMNVITGEPEPRTVGGKAVVFVPGLTFYEHQSTSALYQLDPETSRVTPVKDSASGAGEWIIDQAGAVRGATGYSELAHRWELWLNHDHTQRVGYAVPSMIDAPTVEGLSPDDSSVVLRMVEDGHDIFRAVSLKDGTAGQPIEAYRRFSSLLLDPVTRRIIGGVTTGTTADYVFFDAKDEAAWEGVLKRFPDEDVELDSMSNDRSRVVVRVTGSLHGIAYVLVDTRTGQVLKVGDAYATLKPDDIAAVEAIEYKAADGRKIPAFLTLPNDKPAKNLPLVVLPHGGPAAMDEPGFDWWAQALASRGYAVLQPQFRGSSGYGWEFLAAGFGEWGRKMQTDLSDGVRALAGAGMIDPKRVCIVGASYGGYAALAGPTLDPGVYRCAISVSGLSDLRKMLAWTRERQGTSYTPNIRYWDRFMGGKDPSDPSLDAVSPIRHLDKVSVPILLIHGKDDTVVPIEQSQIIADALKAQGKQVEFVILPSEDHWLSRSDTRLQMLQATVTFLEANNPPQ